jgi:hypothetical protein
MLGPNCLQQPRRETLHWHIGPTNIITRCVDRSIGGAFSMHPTEGFTVGREVHKTIPLQHSALRCIGDTLNSRRTVYALQLTHMWICVSCSFVGLPMEVSRKASQFMIPVCIEFNCPSIKITCPTRHGKRCLMEWSTILWSEYRSLLVSLKTRSS